MHEAMSYWSQDDFLYGNTTSEESDIEFTKTTTLPILGGSAVRPRPFAAWPIFGEREEQALLEAVRSGAWGKLQGERVKAFEQRFAHYHQAAYGIAVASGTVALRLALLAAVSFKPTRR